MAMSFGKGYLNGGKSQSAKPAMADHEEEPDGDEGGETDPIHAHLKKMHGMDGKAHSHVVHHGDGTHEAHHVDEGGNVQGPEETDDCPGGMCGGGM